MNALFNNYDSFITEPSIPNIDFSSFCKIPSDEISRIRKSETYSELKENIFIDFFSFIIGHELGHLHLNHNTISEITSEEYRNQEHAADDFGYELAERAGFSPLFGISIAFPLLAIEEYDSDRVILNNSHPPTSCRLARRLENFRKFFDSLDRDKMTNYQSHFKITAEQFEGMFSEIPTICNSDLLGE
ncbi:MAG: hypothetical protein IPM20_06115 [Gammaproteobacteria bacterium]|nr:hypothetical protein [Gammaproteobacteria bacterium]